VIHPPLLVQSGEAQAGRHRAGLAAVVIYRDVRRGLVPEDWDGSTTDGAFGE